MKINEVDNNCQHVLNSLISYSYDMNIPQNYLINPGPMHVAVTLDKDENIKEYLGPKKPHTFAMKEGQIIEIAKNNGVKDL